MSEAGKALPDQSMEQAWAALRLRNWDGALDLCQAVLARAPAHSEALRAMAISLWGLQRSGEAIAVLERASRSNPGDPHVWSDLGVLRFHGGDLPGAADAFANSTDIDCDNATALHGLGQCYIRMHRYKDAIPVFRRCVRLSPDKISYGCALGQCLAAERQFTEAARVAEKCVARDPRSETALLLLAGIRHHQLRLDEALALTKAAARANPSSFAAQSHLALALWNCGELEMAVETRQHALLLKPTDRNLHCNLTWLALHDSSQHAASLLQIHRTTALTWKVTNALHLAHENSPDPERRLRVGYISAEYVRNPEFCFLHSWLQHHDREQVESFYYMPRPSDDDISERYQSSADHVRDVRALDDAALAGVIRNDRIDVLVDLAGNMDCNRIPLFSLRPAPVQVAYPHYPSTTGVDEIDYILTDSWATPEGSDSEYAEKPYRLPSGYLVYQPLVDLQPSASLPALERGHVTFGMFQRPGKYHSRTWDAVAAILMEVPESRLLIHFQSADLEEEISAQRSRLTSPLRARGIAPERLIFVGTRALLDHLRIVSEADMALDSFPYNGQTTTCDCLWMGVPVIGLRGSSHVARIGQALLERAGLADLTALTIQEYVRKAVNLAGDLQRLAELRAELPSRASAALGDGRRLAREIESGYRWMWRQWCDSRQ
jgi:predicted O-linked N-acetylglucosamine transferase (SPINDLY family)